MADVTLTNKTFEICGQWSASLYYGSEVSINIATLPAWISGSLDTVNKVVSLDFDPTGITAGTYTYDLTAFTITVNVYDSCFTSLPACCTNSVEVRWLNRFGGWQNMQFDYVRGFDVRVEGARTFKTNDVVRYQSMGTVYEGERLAIDVLNRSQYDYLIGIKYAIQAFIGSVPIKIDQASFPKYDQNTRIYEIAFTFIYGEEVHIQRQ